MISKTTFYNHYQDTYALETEPEHELLIALFHDKLDTLTKKIEAHQQKLYPPQKQMMLSILIGGAVHLMTNPDRDNREVKEFLVETITKAAR